jgi:hypothetical protein
MKEVERQQRDEQTGQDRSRVMMGTVVLLRQGCVMGRRAGGSILATR